MRVLQLGKFYPPFMGGIERITHDITEGLNANGIQCDVLCSNDKDLYEESKVNGYTIYRVRSYGKYFSTSIAPQMISMLREMQHRYDVIHVHLPNPMANLALFMSRPQSKVVLHWHSDIVRQRNWLMLYEPLQEWLLRRADKIIATSPKYVLGSKYLLAYNDKVVVIPPGISKCGLPVKYQKLSEIRRKFKKKIVLSIGRLAYYKGFQFLIEAGKYLNEDYVILIGGMGELDAKLRDIIATNNLCDKVILLGNIPDDELGAYYEACDLFCMSSVERSEAFGMVQIEAMSFGKPVVATKIEGSGVDWVNSDQITGLNVEIKNPHAIADAIIKILENSEFYQFLSKNCLDRVATLFAKDIMISAIIDLYSAQFTDELLCS